MIGSEIKEAGTPIGMPARYRGNFDYSLYFLKMIAALCPPNPKVLESTVFISRF